MLSEHMLPAQSAGDLPQSTCCCSTEKRNSAQAEVLVTAKPIVGNKASISTRYRPLIAIGAVALAGGLMSALAAHHMALEIGMRTAMGLFLVPLALLKLFDISGFAAGFASYDPIARVFPAYAQAYPILEALSGLCFLTGLLLVYANIGVIVMFGVNSIGVFASLRRGEKLTCACVGTRFSIPLGGVTLAEDIFMFGMAAGMLAM